MAVQDWSATPDENTTIDGLDIAEHCPAKNINDAIRSVMASVKKNDASVVHTADAETITGAKTFAQGPYATITTLSGANITLDPAQGSLFYVQIKENTTIAISNPPAGKGAIITLVLYYDGTSRITWPNMYWAGQQFPALVNGYNVLNFLKFQDSLNWIGTVSISGALYIDLS